MTQPDSSSKARGWQYTLLVKLSPLFLALFATLAAVGYYLGSGIQLKLSLTDLLPNKHPAVVKFEKLTEVVGGVGFFTIVLHADDGKSHLEAAPAIAGEFAKSKLVKNVFYHREQRYFTDRLLYYLPTEDLRKLQQNIDSEITRSKRKLFDIGLWDEEKEEKKDQPKESIFNKEVKDLARKSASVSQYLTSKDGKYLLMMVKPTFDSMDLGGTRDLMKLSEEILKKILPAGVTYEFAERYYNKIVETEIIQTDIFVSGTASILLISLIIFLYLGSFRGLILIFAPVFIGMGLTIGITYLVIGHINIITGFLMGIVSGLGVDYGIHLLLRLRLEKQEPSSADPDPVFRTLLSSGHSVFIGAASAALSFFLLCFSSFRAFSEFGFICGVGITAVLVSLLTCFSALARVLKIVDTDTKERQFPAWMKMPVLSLPKGFAVGLAITAILFILGFAVGFEYDFEKMMQHSKKMETLSHLVDDIYDRSSVPSAISVSDKATALAIEKEVKQKYMPHLVSELISGASIIPEEQDIKQPILVKIGDKLTNLKDKWIEASLDVPGHLVRSWVKAKPFALADIPPHVQDALRGTKGSGYLLYLYPAIKLHTADGVYKYSKMLREIESAHPEILTGSDAVIFADILDLIHHDGLILLLVIFTSVGLFIWVNVRNFQDAVLSYVPLVLSLPVGMGLMAILGLKFNIFNIAIIPTFVAMGIDVPIHILHRAQETRSGYRAARDLAASIHLALMTAAVGFGVLIFARAGVLKSLGWIALVGTLAIWWIGLVILPAFLEYRMRRTETVDNSVTA